METVPSVFKQLAASFLNSATAIVAKLIHSMPLSEFIYLRSLAGVLLGYFVLYFLNMKIYDYNRKTMNCLLLRGVIGSLGSFGFFYGLQYISLSEAFMINRLSPLWTSLISIYILKKQKMNRRLIICLSMSLCGLYLIICHSQTNKKETSSSNYIFGLMIVLLASISHGVLNSLVSTLSKEVNSIVIQQYQSFFQMLPGLLYPLFFDGKSFVIPSQLEILMIFIISVGNICQGVLNFQSLREGKLSIISNVSQSQIIFAFLIDLLVFKHAVVTINQALGNLFMLVSIIIIVNQKN